MALGKGQFHHFEIFDVPISSGVYPSVYASLSKLGPSTYTRTPTVGADNHLVVAIQHNLVDGGMGALEDYARRAVELLSGFYGSIEREVQWSRAVGDAYHTAPIDMRWHDRGWSDYHNGAYNMGNWIPRLYWGNILSRVHFKDGDPYSVPSWAVSKLEEWHKDLFYVRFTEDPQKDADFAKRITPYFNIIPR